jgi:hypothetical protein
MYRPEQLYDIDVSSHLTPNNNENLRGKEEYFIFIVYTGKDFQLWLPQRNTRNIMTESTKHVTKKTAQYQLVQCTTGNVVSMGYFETLGNLHYCCVEDGEAGIYRVLPANVREFTITTPIFIYISCIEPLGCKLAGYIDQDGVPAAFVLDPAINKTVIVMKHKDRFAVEQTIQEEFKLNTIY